MQGWLKLDFPPPYSHRDLETVLGGFNVAYNGRRQRVLKGLSPAMVLRLRLNADPAFANPTYKSPEPNLIKRALRIITDAKEVSQPDSYRVLQSDLRSLLGQCFGCVCQHLL